MLELHSYSWEITTCSHFQASKTRDEEHKWQTRPGCAPYRWCSPFQRGPRKRKAPWKDCKQASIQNAPLFFSLPPLRLPYRTEYPFPYNYLDDRAMRLKAIDSAKQLAFHSFLNTTFTLENLATWLKWSLAEIKQGLILRRIFPYNIKYWSVVWTRVH